MHLPQYEQAFRENMLLDLVARGFLVEIVERPRECRCSIARRTSEEKSGSTIRRICTAVAVACDSRMISNIIVLHLSLLACGLGPDWAILSRSIIFAGIAWYRLCSNHEAYIKEAAFSI